MTPQAIELKALAQNYCSLVDGFDPSSRDWLSHVHELLPRLHAAVSTLNRLVPENAELMAIDLEARFELYTHLKEYLGELDAYWMQYDVAGDGQTMSGSLADDLTDIYCELKQGLRLYDDEPDRAVAGWLQGYRLHWGQHLIDAERHLYDLSVSKRLIANG